MARIIRAPAAESDAVEIWSYIAEDNPRAADRLLDRFDRVCRTISRQPQLGKSVEELAPKLPRRRNPLRVAHASSRAGDGVAPSRTFIAASPSVEIFGGRTAEHQTEELTEF